MSSNDTNSLPFCGRPHKSGDRAIYAGDRATAPDSTGLRASCWGERRWRVDLLVTAR